MRRIRETKWLVVGLALVPVAGSILPAALSAQSPEAVQAIGGSIMEQRCEDEVVQLHGFFQDWFNGTLPPTEDEFRRFSSVMAEGFVIISPSGELTERDELLERLRDAHGIWREMNRPGRIWIESLQVRHQVGDQVLVLYEEWQEIEGEPRGRLSTALFRRREGTPNGVEWMHVHEVWLPE
ncbi:MAG: hypothetical protein GWP16_04900 [Nitrospirae bacterium]|nr:hypothetical protein [Nitrospirota bacterium]